MAKPKANKEFEEASFSFFLTAVRCCQGPWPVVIAMGAPMRPWLDFFRLQHNANITYVTCV